MAPSTSRLSIRPSSGKERKVCTPGGMTNPPENVRAALNSHPRFKAFANVPGPELAVSCRIITRHAAQRIVTAAFEYAKKRSFKGVTICEKPNVVRETSGMMEEVAKEVAAKYPASPCGPPTLTRS